MYTDKIFKNCFHQSVSAIGIPYFFVRDNNCTSVKQSDFKCRLWAQFIFRNGPFKTRWCNCLSLESIFIINSLSFSIDEPKFQPLPHNSIIKLLYKRSDFQLENSKGKCKWRHPLFIHYFCGRSHLGLVRPSHQALVDRYILDKPETHCSSSTHHNSKW